MSTYRILAIDGGGILGTYPAAFLADIEQRVGQNLGRYFDLIVGTSTGGIIALALGLDIPAGEILGLYQEMGPNVFKKPETWRKKWRRCFRGAVVESKHDPAPLEESVTKAFGQRKLGQSITRLVIPSMSLASGKVYIFKTAHNERFKTDYKRPAVEVAMATTAAPTYLPPHKNGAGVPLIDGGMYANCPAGLAAVEAAHVLGWAPGSFDILSLGTTTTPMSAGLREELPGSAVSWLKGLALIDCFMCGQASASLGTAMLIAGEKHLFRVDETLPNGRFEMDDSDAVTHLRGLASERARTEFPRLESVFFEKPVEPFEPYHKL